MKCPHCETELRPSWDRNRSADEHRCAVKAIAERVRAWYQTGDRRTLEDVIREALFECSGPVLALIE